jgi:outer membrane immunogenic protein
MKKLFTAFAMLGALLAGPAMAADMPLKAPVYKAPAPVYTWTGCYIGGGGGSGMFDASHDLFTDPPAATLASNLTTGGRGILGVVGGGCDVQIGGSWVVGAFADVDWASIKGQQSWPCGAGCPFPNSGVAGEISERRAWGAGGRIGYLVTPALLTYFDGGYTGATFSQANYTVNAVGVGFPGGATGIVLPQTTYGGYFLGGGTEYAFSWIPGLFWKTEYRMAEYSAKTISDTCVAVAAAGCGAVGPAGVSERIHPFVQTIWTQLVWRFNWAGPVAAKY